MSPDPEPTTPDQPDDQPAEWPDPQADPEREPSHEGERLPDPDNPEPLPDLPDPD